ncbi:hypothetical protein ACWDRB_47610 [Nonomuraea sp. NPDC003707]
MNHADGVAMLREALARAGPRAAEALRDHELEKARRLQRLTRLDEPGRWERADAAAAEVIARAALQRRPEHHMEVDTQEQAVTRERWRAESLARARARARRERAERSMPTNATLSEIPGRERSAQ